MFSYHCAGAKQDSKSIEKFNKGVSEKVAGFVRNLQLFQKQLSEKLDYNRSLRSRWQKCNPMRTIIFKKLTYHIIKTAINSHKKLETYIAIGLKRI